MTIKAKFRLVLLNNLKYTKLNILKIFKTVDYIVPRLKHKIIRDSQIVYCSILAAH